MTIFCGKLKHDVINYFYKYKALKFMKIIDLYFRNAGALGNPEQLSLK